jgi:hypothetical protein
MEHCPPGNWANRSFACRPAAAQALSPTGYTRVMSGQTASGLTHEVAITMPLCVMLRDYPNLLAVATSAPCQGSADHCPITATSQKGLPGVALAPRDSLCVLAAISLKTY